MTRAGQISQISGRILHLQALRQFRVYEGLFEGLPTAERNKEMVANLVEQERRRGHRVPYLVPPVEKPIEYDRGKKYPFGTPSALPEIACLGRFKSLSPARDMAKDYSELLVIWFQDDFAFPIDPGVLEQIRVIDWERLAYDLEY